MFFRSCIQPFTFTPEIIDARKVFTAPTLDAFSRNLIDLEAGRSPGNPIALWLHHRERGDCSISSESTLQSVMCFHEHRVETYNLETLGPCHQSAVRDILGAFFLEGNLCEAIYAAFDLDIHAPLQSAHFRTFSLFWEPDSFEAFEAETEYFYQDQQDPEQRDSPVLKICTLATNTNAEAIAQRMQMRRALRLIQGYGVLGNGEFDLSQHGCAATSHF